MKIAIIVFVVLVFAVALIRRAMIRKARSAAYEDLKALPVFAHDFTTPEGAILCLEDAYRRRDIEAAVAAKDFETEARLLLQKTGLAVPADETIVANTAEALVASFRGLTTASWPNFEGLESFFTKREPYADNVVLVTEMCRFPDGGFSTQKMLVANTPQGWRVLNPVSE